MPRFEFGFLISNFEFQTFKVWHTGLIDHRDSLVGRHREPSGPDKIWLFDKKMKTKFRNSNYVPVFDFQESSVVGSVVSLPGLKHALWQVLRRNYSEYSFDRISWPMTNWFTQTAKKLGP